MSATEVTVGRNVLEKRLPAPSILGMADATDRTSREGAKEGRVVGYRGSVQFQVEPLEHCV